MAKKQKDKPMLNLDGVEYAIEDMTDAQKELANEVARNQNHVNDLNNKLATNLHVNEQLSATLKVFNEKHQQGVKELKKAMEPTE